MPGEEKEGGGKGGGRSLIRFLLIYLKNSELIVLFSRTDS
jgi:hypothetical protein